MFAFLSRDLYRVWITTGFLTNRKASILRLFQWNKNHTGQNRSCTNGKGYGFVVLGVEDVILARRRAERGLRRLRAARLAYLSPFISYGVTCYVDGVTAPF